MFLNLLIITLIIVFIVDISGAVDHLVKPIVRKVLNIPKSADIRIPPFDCSLCLSFWICLIYLIVTSDLTIINAGAVCVLSYMTTTFKAILITIKDALDTLLYKINELLHE